MLKYIPIILLIFISNRNIFSQGLNDISGNQTGYIISVGDSGRLVTSSNYGLTWIINKLSETNFNGVFCLNNNKWIAGDNGNVVKLNKSDSVIINITLGNNINLTSLFFVNDGTGFVCGSNGKVFKTTNGGFTWLESNIGIGKTELNSIVFLSLSEGYAVGNSGSIYRTINGGMSWTKEATGTEKNITGITRSNDTLICCGDDGLILIGNSGKWSIVNSLTNSDLRDVNRDEFGVLRVCGGAGFIRNNKTTPFLTFETNPMRSKISAMFFSDNKYGYSVSSSGLEIIKTTNGGQSWSFANPVNVLPVWELKLSGQTNGFGNTLAMHPKDKNSFFVCYGDKIYVSRDKGDTWILLSTINYPGISRTASFWVSSADTNVWLASVFVSFDCPVIRTTNYGLSWHSALDSIQIGSYTKPLEMDPNIPGNFYIATNNKGFFSSTDNGTTFIQKSNYDFNNPCDMMVQFGNSQEMLIADASYPSTDSSTILRTTNAGLNWHSVLRAGINEVPAITGSVFQTQHAYTAAEVLYSTTNFGNNWSGFNSSFEALWALDVCREDPTNIFTARYSGRCFISSNSGSSFSIINNPSSAVAFSAVIFPERDFAIAEFNNSLYKLKFKTDVNVSVNPLSQNISSGYSLFQNFPNPFNPNTTLEYEISKHDVVKLTVHDISGREIAELVNDVRSPGRYSILFDGSGLSSGVYFYKLEVKDKILTRKMLFIK